jgi:hypothetical protein
MTTMLTIRQQAIKKYVRERQAAGKRCTIQGIARAFEMTDEDVRYALSKIRLQKAQTKNSFTDTFDDFMNTMGFGK